MKFLAKNISPGIVLFLSLFVSSGSVVAIQPQVQTYNELLRAIRTAREASEQRVQQAIQQETVRRAWETGKLIDGHVLQHQERAAYAQQVLVRLAKDLGMSSTELYYSLRFARVYPDALPAFNLSWKNYRELIFVDDAAVRERLAAQAFKENWSWDKLRFEIKKFKQGDSGEKPVLVAVPGKIGAYRVVKAETGPYQGELVLDLGFSNYYKIEKMEFEENERVEVQCTNSARCIFRTVKNRPDSDLFTYRVNVIRVVDGDILHALIDLGFGITTVQTLRLRGLDAMEMDTAEGQKAKEFLGKRLKTNARIQIKAVRPDKYDRYLADVWLGESYLNQELIENGLAMMVGQ